jgi:hypothetical protein
MCCRAFVVTVFLLSPVQVTRSVIADIRGRIGGMLTGGSGKTKSSDMTYATLFWCGYSSVSRLRGSPTRTSALYPKLDINNNIEDLFSFRTFFSFFYAPFSIAWFLVQMSAVTAGGSLFRFFFIFCLPSGEPGDAHSGRLDDA